MTTKFAGEAAIQAVIDETKKLTRPEVGIGNLKPVDEDAKLYIAENEQGDSPEDFYTKTEVDNLIKELSLKIIQLSDRRNNIIRRMSSGYVDDPGDFPPNYPSQSRTLHLNDDWEGTLIIQCKTATNPETEVFTTFCLGGYLFNIEHLAGRNSSDYIGVSGAFSYDLTITNKQVGCGKIYYDIILIPFQLTN